MYLVGVNWKIVRSEISNFYPIKLDDTLYLQSHDGYIYKKLLI